MSIQKIELFQWWTTPQELRQIADRLEEQYKHCRAGMGLPKVVVFNSTVNKDGVDRRLEVTIAQERVPK